MPKDLTFNEDVRKKILSGMEKVNNAVGSTLGPNGNLVAIEKTDMAPVLTKDGVTVSKSIFLEDPVENVGAQLLKEAASKTNNDAGDNTTTSTILGYSIAKNAFKAIDAGFKPIELKRGIEKATSDVVEILKANSKKVSTDEEILAVASISANNDPVIGSLISEAIGKVGKDSTITVEESRDMNSSVKITTGIQFDNGYLSPYFSTDKEKLTVEYDSAKILLTDKSISSMAELMPILESVVQSGNPLIIIADDVQGEALGTLVLNSVRGTIKACAVKAPSFGEQRKNILEDIAVLTGATVVSNELGMNLASTSIDMLGTAKVKITKDSTVITNGCGSKEKLEERISEIKGQIENNESDYEKEKLKKRVAALTNGVAVICVGAATESELKEKKFRIEDALCATRSALDGGILPGGGSALVNVSKEISKPTFEFEGEERGYNILLQSICEPLKRISENSGINGEVVLNKILENNDGKEFGYNARTNHYGNMYEMKIIDTYKGIASALTNAASVAGNVIMCNCSITEVVKDVPQPMLMQTPAGPMPY